MPYPQNLEVAEAVEAIVRNNGAVPATIAILDGTPFIGFHSELFLCIPFSLSLDVIFVFRHRNKGLELVFMSLNCMGLLFPLR